MYRILTAATGVCLLTLSGCGGSSSDVVPVTGRVTYQGEPAENAEVIFMPESGRPASGITDAQGNFALTTNEEGDGAVVGRHQVSIGQHFPPGEAPPMPGPGQPLESKFPAKYANPQTSGIEREVTRDGKNDFQLEME